MGLDLGGLITDVAGTYINARWGGPAAPAAVATQPISPATLNTLRSPAPGGAPGMQQFVGTGEGVFGLPGYDVVDTDKGKGMVYDPNANCGAGKWIRKRRRRHRNLATRGDIRDLSALKGVLGSGKLLETWIATHS